MMMSEDEILKALRIPKRSQKLICSSLSILRILKRSLSAIDFKLIEINQLKKSNNEQQDALCEIEDKLTGETKESREKMF